jgi:hypothetical protein
MTGTAGVLMVSAPANGAYSHMMVGPGVGQLLAFTDHCSRLFLVCAFS